MLRDSLQKFLKSHSIQKALVMVSGGPDSLVLLDLLKEKNIHALHINYKLRGKESDADEETVRLFCAKNKIPLEVRSPEKLSASGLQAEARNFRYQEALKYCSEKNISHLFTAHHQDDQIETFIFRLMRGNHLFSLASMDESISFENIFLHRPLLSFSKKEILKYAEKNKISFRLDASNEKGIYSRNKIRLWLMPSLEKKDPAFRTKILKAQQVASESKKNFEKQNQERGAQKLWGGGYKIPLSLLENFQSGYPTLQSFIAELKPESFLPEKNYRSFLDSLKKKKKWDQVIGGVRFETNGAYLLVTEQKPEKGDWEIEVNVPGNDEIPFKIRNLRRGDFLYSPKKSRHSLYRQLTKLKVSRTEKERVLVLEREGKVRAIYPAYVDSQELKDKPAYFLRFIK